MEMAISSGAPEEVTGLLALLESMNKASVTRELTGCYGGQRGNPPRADENGLFRMTVPLLHAAFTGSTAMFATVLGAMRAKLKAQQASPVSRCLFGYSLCRRSGPMVNSNAKRRVDRRVLVHKMASPWCTTNTQVHEGSLMGLHEGSRFDP